MLAGKNARHTTQEGPILNKAWKLVVAAAAGVPGILKQALLAVGAAGVWATVLAGHPKVALRN